MILIEKCRTLISIDSSVSHGTQDIVDHVEDLAKSWGLHTEVQQESFNGVENSNIIISTGPIPSGGALVFISRLDTDDPGDYGHWSKTGANPFSASVNGDIIHGLGAADAKSDFICRMMALKDSKNHSYKKMFPVLVGTYGGASGAGAIRLIRKKKMDIKNVVVSMPTQLNFAAKGPGYAKVEVFIPFSKEEVTYQQKHNTSENSISQSRVFARAPKSEGAEEFYENPILKLIDYLKKLPDGTAIISIDGGTSSESTPDTAFLELDIVDTLPDSIVPKLVKIGEAIKILSAELKTVVDIDCDPTFSTITLGQIRTIPDGVMLSGICRLIPTEGRELYDNWLGQLRAQCENLGARFQILDYKPPFQSNAESELFELLEAAAIKSDIKSKKTAAVRCTEASVFHRFGSNVVGFGPGQIKSHDHASNEQVNIKDIHKAYDFYKNIFEGLKS